MITDGFFVLTGHALTEDEITRQVDIGYVGPDLTFSTMANGMIGRRLSRKHRWTRNKPCKDIWT